MGGGTPSQVQVGGYPIPGLGRGVPEVLPYKVWILQPPLIWDGVAPRIWDGVPPILGWGSPPDMRWGTPLWTWDWVPPQTWDQVPPRPGTRYPQTWDRVPPWTWYWVPPPTRSGLDRVAQRVLATRRAVCLLRSHRRTFLFTLLLRNSNTCGYVLN